MSNKLTLIVDGNWLFMTHIFIHSRELKADTPTGYSHIQQGFLASIRQILCNIPEIDNFIIVSDNGSWRKQLDIPECVDVTYKGNRVSDPSYNWERIWETWENLKTSLAEQGITVANGKGIEGDDWCAYWSGYLRKQGISNIIWTKDHDLMQLVKETNGVWTGWYNENDGLYLNLSQRPENQFFAPITSGAVLLDSLRRSVKNISYIEPVSEIIVGKVLNGDVSDNIKPILWYRRTTKTGKEQVCKLTKKEIPYSLDIDNDEQVNSFIREQIKSPKFSHLKFEEVREHFEYNKKLVILNSKYYPESVKKSIVENLSPYYKAPADIKLPDINPEPIVPGTSFNEILDLL